MEAYRVTGSPLRAKGAGPYHRTRTSIPQPSARTATAPARHVGRLLIQRKYGFPKPGNASYNTTMSKRSIEIGPTGIQTAHNIESLRLARGISQRQLAALVAEHGRPLSHSAISRIERIRRRCDVDDLATLAAALGISPMALLQPLGAAQEAGHRG
ncbi:helix-turn-helix domain-containing protein [Streptomyces sp. NPDC002446]